MPAEQSSGGVRVFGEKRAINYNDTQAFFESRADIAGENSLTATMYQDAALAGRRDAAEKQTTLPLLKLRGDDRVLDIGCGSGRWAQIISPATSAYLGIDFSSGLLKVARARVRKAVFQCMAVNVMNPSAFPVPPPFTLIVASGILTYLNDADVRRLFINVSQIAAPDSRCYVREPVAKVERLTLDGYWSEELGASYSAVYRTRAEYLDLFCALEGFRLRYEGEPFPPHLQNRAETEQRFFLLERAARD